MATQSLYTPEVVTLEGGLDFTTPRTQVAPGSLLDCYNYEVVDRLGYKRVDGIDLYDGRPSASLAYDSLYKARWTGLSSFDAPAVGAYIYTQTSNISPYGNATTAFGYILTVTSISTSNWDIEFVVFNTDVFLQVFANPSTTLIRTTLSHRGGHLSSIKNEWLYDALTTVSDRATAATTAYSLIKESTSVAPLKLLGVTNTGYNLVPGLQYYKNSLYAIQDISYIYFDSGTLTGTDITDLLPNDILSYTNAFSGFDFHFLVRYVEILSGSWATSDATGIVYVSYLGSPATNVFSCGAVSGPEYSAVDSIVVDLELLDVQRGSTPLTSTGALRINSSLTNGDTPISVTNPIKFAGLLKANTLDDIDVSVGEGAIGWQEVELGYMFQFGAATTNSDTTGAPSAPGRTTTPTGSQISTSAATDGFVPAGAGNVTTTAVHSLTPWTFAHTASAMTIGTMITANATHTRQYGGNGNAATDPAQCLTQNVTGAVNEATYGAVSLFGAAASGVSYNINEEYVLTGFTFPEIPADSIILGVTVDVGGYSMPAGTYASARFSSRIAVRLQTDSGSSDSLAPQISAPKNNVVSGSTSTPAVIDKTTNLGIANCTHLVLGGSSDLWGLSSITPALLPSLKVRLSSVAYGGSGPGVAAAGITGVHVTVYYTTSSSVFYFNNGTDDVKGIITNTYVDDGQVWTDGSTGTMQVVDVQPYDVSARNMIQSGDIIYILPGGSGTVGQKSIATVSSDMVFAGLPSSAILTQNNSRYELVNSNFYANADWEAMYGVSGADKAFAYDGFYFRYIFTGTPAALEKPRHISTHNEHLCLGYLSGTLLASVGGSPEDFSGLNGATEFSTGDYITGLLKLDGTTLGVFCKSSIWGISGTDSTTWSENMLSPHEGAIEYTVVDAGRPTYCTYRGISTFTASAGYGNFTAGRLSSNVTPWLLPRLTGDIQSISLTTTGPATFGNIGPICAYPVKNKNQYRVVFKDGYILTLTFTGAENSPVFTLSRVTTGRTGSFPNYTAVYLNTLGVTWGVNKTGRDVIYMTQYNSSDAAIASRVYEIDRGWGFLDANIAAYFTTTYNFLDNPFQKSKLAKVRLHGLSKGLATLNLAVSGDYTNVDLQNGSLFGVAQSNAIPQDISLPRNGGDAVIGTTGDITNDYRPCTNIADMSKEGSNFAFQIATTGWEPPHICQSLMLQITTNKADV